MEDNIITIVIIRNGTLHECSVRARKAGKFVNNIFVNKLVDIYCPQTKFGAR